MATWGEFKQAAGGLAALAEERLTGGLVVVATLRANGWPRVSPVESLVVDDGLYLGMMWRSRKALDLLRDPRCTVHNVTSADDGSDGDVKLYGRARDVAGHDERERYCAALFARTGWRPAGDFHLFAVELCEAGYFQSSGGNHLVWHWREGEDLPEPELRPATS